MPPENDNVDYRQIEGWLEGRAARDRPDHPSGGGPSGSGTDDLVRRVGALESVVGRVNDKADTLIKDVAEIKGRLSQMPTTFQMLTWFVGVALGLVGLVFAVARSVGTH